MANGSQQYDVPNTNGNIKLKIEWWSNSSIEGNYSDVTVVATIIRGRHGYNTNNTSDVTRIWIDGNMHESRHSIGGNSNSSTEIARATQRINHAEDGNKTIDIRVMHDFRLSFSNNWIGERTFSMSQQRLDTILRASDFNLPERSVMGSGIVITLEPKIASFEHTIRFKWYDKDDVIGRQIKNTLNWTPPLRYAQDVPDAISSWGTVVVETWLNGNKIGEKTKVITLTIPEDIKPTLSSVVIEDTNRDVVSMLGQQNYYVQAKSNLKVTYQGSLGSYGSTITNYRSEIVNTTHYADGDRATLGVMHFNGTMRIKSYITDSRGRQSEPIYNTINVLEYVAPTGYIQVTRGGERKNQVVVTIDATVAPLMIGNRQKNILKINVLSAEKGGNYSQDMTNTSTAIATYKKQRFTLSKAYEPNKSYLIKLEVWDAFSIRQGETHVFAVETLGTEIRPFALHPHGAMVNTLEMKGALHVNGDSYFNGKIKYLDNDIQVHPFTQTDGNCFDSMGKDFNLERKTGVYWKRSTDANNPVREYGWLFVYASGHNILQRFVSSGRKEYLRIQNFWDNRTHWTPWDVVYTSKHPATSLVTMDGGWACKVCPRGTDFGNFLKSSNVPVGFSVIRDENTYANVMVIKENSQWIYGLTIRDGRIDIIVVANSSYKGYRGITIS